MISNLRKLNSPDQIEEAKEDEEFTPEREFDTNDD